MQAKTISTFRLDVTIALAMVVLHGALMVLNQMLSRAQFQQHKSITRLRNGIAGTRKAKGVFPRLSLIDSGEMKMEARTGVEPV